MPSALVREPRPPPNEISAAGFSSSATFTTSMMGSIARHRAFWSIFIAQNLHI
ncbi:MAG: hypothetical protein R3B70_00935 [Polyangiaceae bacterium]